MTQHSVIVLFACLVWASSWPAHAMYNSGGAVKLVNAKNFKSKILETELPAIVEFYAPWCGHCKSLAPAYEKVAESLHGIVNIAAVDCDVEANKPLCSKYGVQGFPTLKSFGPGKSKKRVKDYSGPRTARGIAEAATSALHDKLISRPTTLQGFAAFLEGSKLPKVMLYSSKAATSTLYKSLSMRFKGRLHFAEVRQAAEELIQAGGVTSFPSLQIVTTDGSRTLFEGKLKADALVPYLSKVAKAAEVGDLRGKESIEKERSEL